MELNLFVGLPKLYKESVVGTKSASTGTFAVPFPILIGESNSNIPLLEAIVAFVKYKL